MTKRIVCAALSVLFILAAFSSCGVPLTEDEAKEIAAPLIEKSYEINEIFFGKGLPHIEDNTEDTGDNTQYDVKPVKYLSAATD